MMNTWSEKKMDRRKEEQLDKGFSFSVFCFSTKTITGVINQPTLRQ